LTVVSFPHLSANIGVQAKSYSDGTSHRFTVQKESQTFLITLTLKLEVQIESGSPAIEETRYLISSPFAFPP
jgi:hypothetical protein